MLNSTSLNVDFKPTPPPFASLDRQIMDESWFQKAKPFLQEAFDAFKPRSAFLSKSQRLDERNFLQLEEDERPNIVLRHLDLATEKTEGIPYFDEVFAECPGYETLQAKFRAIETFVRPRIRSCKTHFITFSTNMTGANKGIQHIHPLMNGDRCNVWSFCVPLYLSSENGPRHQFWYNHQEDLFKSRYYLDYRHLKKLNISYSSFTMPVDGKIFSIQFDGARTPHYIDYTKHLYAWFVFDGVEYRDEAPRLEAFTTRLH